MAARRAALLAAAAAPAAPVPVVHYGPSCCSCGGNATCQGSPAANEAYNAMFTRAGAAEWAGVRGRIDVYNFHVNMWNTATQPSKPCQYLSDATLKAAAGLISAGNLSVSVETGALRPFSGCTEKANWGGAAAHQAHNEKQKFERWAGLGGTVTHVWMDSPVSKMMAGGQKGNCGMDMAAITEQLAAAIATYRSMFPAAQVALIEPVPWYSVTAGNVTYPKNPGPTDYGEYTTMLSTVQRGLAQHGARLDAVVTDSPYTFNKDAPAPAGTTDPLAGWKRLRAVSDFVRGTLKLQYGHYFNDNAGGASSDELFSQNTIDELAKNQQVGAVFDQASVRSWYEYPTTFIPEGQTGTFTNLMSKFMDAL